MRRTLELFMSLSIAASGCTSGNVETVPDNPEGISTTQCTKELPFDQIEREDLRVLAEAAIFLSLDNTENTMVIATGAAATGEYTNASGVPISRSMQSPIVVADGASLETGCMTLACVDPDGSVRVFFSDEVTIKQDQVGTEPYQPGVNNPDCFTDF